LDHQRRLDPRHIRRIRLAAIKRDRGGQIGISHGKCVADPAAVTEADRAHLAGGSLVVAQIFERGEEIGHQLRPVERALHLAPFLIRAGIAAQR